MPAPTSDPVASVHRRRNRYRAIALLVAAALVLLSLSAGVAQAAGRNSLSLGSTGRTVKQLQRRLHVSATGYYGTATRRAVRRYQRRHGLAADGVAGPATLSALGIRARNASYSTGGASPTSAQPSGKLPPVLRRIAQCESGGNPRAVSSSGRYRGKYQFDMATWQGAGGSGDPAATPEWKQDRIALKLYRKRGTAPWPNCA